VSHPSDKTLPDDTDEIETVTSEVADEGGSPGDVEIKIDRLPTRGREGAETVRPTEERREVTVREKPARDAEVRKSRQ
jgi:hypothetical protein